MAEERRIGEIWDIVYRGRPADMEKAGPLIRRTLVVLAVLVLVLIVAGVVLVVASR